MSTLRIGGKWPVVSVLDPIWAYCLICLSDFESRFLNTTEENRETLARGGNKTGRNQDKQTKKYTKHEKGTLLGGLLTRISQVEILRLWRGRSV